jgi:hypothetical protein
MGFRFTKLIVFPLLPICAGLMFSQQPPSDRTEDRPPIQRPASPEEVLERLSHRTAEIYAAMAQISEKDPDRIEKLSHQFALLAQAEENAAVALRSMAANHQNVPSTLGEPARASGTRHSNPGDSAFRR